MSTPTRTDLLGALDRVVPLAAEHITAVTRSTLPTFAEPENFTKLIIRTLIRHADGSRSELDSAVIEPAREMARGGLDSGTVTRFWRIVSHEFWVWLTSKSPIDFELQGAGLAVWSDFLATHERYATAFMDTFFEIQTELRGSELACRRDSLNLLLSGQPPDQTADLLRTLGISSDHVLIARFSYTGSAPNDPADPASRFQPLIRELQAHTYRLPWTVADGRLVLCLPCDERSEESLRRMFERLGASLRVGISRPWSISDSLVGADRQAELALRGTSETTPRVDFGTLSLVEIAALQVDLRAADVPQALDLLLAEDERSDHEWLHTAEALMQSQGSISAAAAALQVHTNTIYYRIAAVQSFSGLDLRNPRVLADIQFIRASRSFGRYMS
jgi:hypothetical protein